MPNVHMQTAARNLGQAVSDLRLLQQQIRADTEQRKRDIQQQISGLKRQQILVKADVNNTDNNTQRVALLSSNKNMDKEIKDLEKAIFSIEDEARKEIEAAENQAVQVDSIAKQLIGMA